MTGPAEQIARTVLYEGYLLWPYRRSAKKNQKRWTFGGVYPRGFSEATGGTDPWRMQTECLVKGMQPRVQIAVRFLQVVERQVLKANADGTHAPVDSLTIGAEQVLSWQEATERAVLAPPLVLTRGLECQIPIDMAAGSSEEPLIASDGSRAGAILRSWSSVAGMIDVTATAVTDEVFRLTVAISNGTPWNGQDRDSALRQTFVSTHTVMTVEDGAFVSLLEPPKDLQEAAERCTNIGTWPVLVGREGERQTVLSSPIILYDYPQVAPESPGDLFDGTEIDQLLTLNILALTDEEKAEMRASDPKARDLLARTEGLSEEELLRLHGTMRDLRGWGELDQRPPATVTVAGREIQKGSRVRLRPRPNGDIMDLALVGQIAVVETIEQDLEGRVHLVVTVEDDPGRDLAALCPGHRFFFFLDEIDVIDGKDGQEAECGERKGGRA